MDSAGITYCREILNLGSLLGAERHDYINHQGLKKT